MSKEFLPKTPQALHTRAGSSEASAQFKDNRGLSQPIKQLQGLEEEELMQGQFKPVQKVDLEEEEPLQGKFEAASQEAVAQQHANTTGLPDTLKTGMEQLSGISLDAVKVHQNSSKPAEVGAHAYAQGTDIHVAPGQEQHLPHELGHVVQQAQGRVQPTTEVGGLPVNDNVGLETEATVMGSRALEMVEGGGKQ